MRRSTRGATSDSLAPARRARDLAEGF